jgi:hypothetical protein
MGNSLYSLILNKVTSKILPVKPMKGLENTNLHLRVVKSHKDTYLLDELESDEVYPTMLQGTIFNQQKKGMTLKDFKKIN